jgi:cyanophycinase
MIHSLFRRSFTRKIVLSACALAGASGAAWGQGYVCAEGGGSPTAAGWGAAVFGWMAQKGGYGDVVILGYSGADNNAANAFLNVGCASATNVVVDWTNANDPTTYAAIVAADIVWIRGGNQAIYVIDWNNTLTEQAIVQVYQNGGVVGGTSAGCAVLSDVIYDSITGSVLAREALRDPYHPFISFTDDFLDLTSGTFFDTHFTERGRIGRLAVFLARQWQDSGRDLLGLGVDDRTAACFSPDGTFEVLGEGAVSVLHRTADTQQSIASGQPPLFTELRLTQLTQGYRFDPTTRSVIQRPSSASFPPPPSGHPSFSSIALSGSDLANAALGDVQVLDQGDPSALFYGMLQVVDGANLLLRTVISTNVWESTTWDENRVGGLQYALALNPHFLGLYLDTDVTVEAIPGGFLAVRPPSGPEAPAVILDSYGLISLDFSTYVSTGQSVGPRQSVALEGAKLHLLPQGYAYDAVAHRPLLTYPVRYCAAKQNSQGCLPRIQSTGFASAAGPGSLWIGASQVINGKSGLLFYGFGPDGLPFQGGTLCVQQPLTRTAVQVSGGNPPPDDCSGSFNMDFNSEIQSGSNPALIAGARVCAQYWYRDPASPSTTGLSDAMYFDVGP